MLLTKKHAHNTASQQERQWPQQCGPGRERRSTCPTSGSRQRRRHTFCQTSWPSSCSAPPWLCPVGAPARQARQQAYPHTTEHNWCYRGERKMTMGVAKRTPRQARSTSEETWMCVDVRVADMRIPSPKCGEGSSSPNFPILGRDEKFNTKMVWGPGGGRKGGVSRSRNRALGGAKLY